MSESIRHKRENESDRMTNNNNLINHFPNFDIKSADIKYNISNKKSELEFENMKYYSKLRCIALTEHMEKLNNL